MESDKSLSLGELLEWGKSGLKSAGLEDFDISAEVLLRDALGISKIELLTDIDRHPDKGAVSKYRNFIEQRARRVPLQYITGHTEFYNVIIKCDPRALIPRPETEILVETVINKLKHLKSPSILDIGTGSGNIAVALAKNIEKAKVLGVDISEEALELARSNAGINDVAKKTRFIVGDINDEIFISSLGRFDCVVSNPPYVSEDQKEILQPEVIEFEPEAALFSKGDPLRFFRIIIGAVRRLLKKNGLLAFEIGLGQAYTIRRMMESAEMEKIEIAKDLAGRERVITGMSSTKIDGA